MNRLNAEDRGARRLPPDDALGTALWLAGIGLALGPAAGVVDLEVDDPEQAGPLLAE